MGGSRLEPSVGEEAKGKSDVAAGLGARPSCCPDRPAVVTTLLRTQPALPYAPKTASRA